jgi:hypothetical protein
MSHTFNFVHSRLAVGGGVVTEIDRNVLIGAGITHAVNLRSHTEPMLYGDSRIICIENGTVDDRQPKEPSWFGRSIQFALLALMRPRTKVLLHCFLGEDRSPSVALAVLMAQGWTKHAAAELILLARPKASLAYSESAAMAVKFLGYI